MITIINKQRKIYINKEAIISIIGVMLEILGYADFDIGIWFTTNKTIRQYNKKYRGKDAATDILSFPFHPELKPGQKINVTDREDKNLGDMIISLEFIKNDASKRWNRSFQQHLTAILAHGVAHLLNYDHQTDAEYAAMNTIEQKLIKAASTLMKTSYLKVD